MERKKNFDFFFNCLQFILKSRNSMACEMHSKGLNDNLAAYQKLHEEFVTASVKTPPHIPGKG